MPSHRTDRGQVHCIHDRVHRRPRRLNRPTRREEPEFALHNRIPPRRIKGDDCRHDGVDGKRRMVAVMTWPAKVEKKVGSGCLVYPARTIYIPPVSRNRSQGGHGSRGCAMTHDPQTLPSPPFSPFIDPSRSPPPFPAWPILKCLRRSFDRHPSRWGHHRT